MIEGRWESMLEDFRVAHRDGGNVAAHLLLVPLGTLGILSLIASLGSVAVALAAGLYLLYVLPRLPRPVGLATAALVGALAWLAATVPLSWPVAIGLVAVGYIGQDIAHAMSGDPTLHSTYKERESWLWDYIEHIVFLPPLVIGSVPHTRSSFLSWAVAHDAVWRRSLRGDGSAAAVRRLAEHARALGGVSERRVDALPEALRADARRLGADPAARGLLEDGLWQGFAVRPLPELDLLRRTGSGAGATTDRLGCTPHTGGVLHLWPLAAVYRSVIAIEESGEVALRFPLSTPRLGERYREERLSPGDVLTHDLHRELHHDLAPPERAEPRTLLHVHHVVYPRWFPLYGGLLAWLTVRLAAVRRRLLPLQGDGAAAGLIHWTQRLSAGLIRSVGYGNLAYLLGAAMLAWLLHDPLVFIAATSFVHYLLYIATFHDRQGVAYGRFLRDALMYKTVSFTPLFAIYLLHFELNPLSIALLVGGHALSLKSTEALGMYRTYFGAELGVVEPKMVESFPYSWNIPHPMIVGSVLGLLGLYANDGLREALPWVVPVHVLCYAIHAVQEHLDVHLSQPAAERSPSASG